MNVTIVYKDKSDHGRTVRDFLADFTRQTGKSISELDPETLEGIDFCRAYDIVEYPTVVAMRDDGVLLTLWRGMPLPTINEVSYYVQ